MAPTPADHAVSTARVTTVLQHPLALWSGFIVVHGLLCAFAMLTQAMSLGDVTLVYEPWAIQAVHGVAVVGVTAPWVYPALAIIPIMLPLLAGAGQYVFGWLAVVVLADAAAFAVLTSRQGQRASAAAWWWLGFLLLLGPIAVGRLDAISVAFVIVALLWLSSRPRVAAVLLAVATWIKVWPAAIIASVLIAGRDRVRTLLAVAATTVVVVILGVTFGSFANVFSFIGQQTGRGLQIEAPISLPWMWAAAAHQPGSAIYYDLDILTFQVNGSGINTAIALSTPLLAIAAIAVLLIGLRATARGTPALTVLPRLSLALVVTLIAFNKVGSPQYIAWIAAPIVLGLVCDGIRFRTPAILTAITALLTQLIYPYLYNSILTADVGGIALLTVRNVLLFVILGWALVSLWQSAAAAQLRKE